ncbi:MAG: hypothetical protein OEZ43_20100 [Gammaproteobacteria bacterium]|nr:hypothetical protein [Gammaproteobacteria bacterium]
MRPIQTSFFNSLSVSIFCLLLSGLSLGFASSVLAAESAAERSHREMDRETGHETTDIEREEAEQRRQAEQRRAAGRRPSPAPSRAQNRSSDEPESWYMMWGMGAALPQYPAADQATIDGYSNSGSRQGVNMDMLGFYWPTTDWMITGFIVNAAADNFKLDNGDTFLSSRGILGASTMIFLGGKIGSGLFIRADAGFGSIAEKLNGIDQKTGQGFGALGGLGWGFPVSNESRVMIGLNYASIYTRNTLYSAPSLSVYGLW